MLFHLETVVDQKTFLAEFYRLCSTMKDHYLVVQLVKQRKKIFEYENFKLT